VLEFATVYKEGGFDVIIGNPPWDVIKADREHYFSKHDEIFRIRSPSDKDAKQEELLDNPIIKQGWEEFQREMEIQSDYFNNTSEYNLQNPSIDGRPVGNENDLSLLFLERVIQLGQDKSYITQVMPGNFFLGGSAKDLREHLLDDTSLSHLVQFENHGIFPNIDERYRFAVTTFKNSGETDTVHGAFGDGNLSAITEFDCRSIEIPRTVLARFSPESRLFPYFRSQSQIDLLSKVVEQPSIGEDIDETWFTEPYREIDRAQDSDRFVESKDDGDYPVYGGSNIFQFSYDDSHVWVDDPTLWSIDEDIDPEKSAKRRIREKQFRGHDSRFSPKKAVYDAFDGSGSQKGFVDDLLESERGHPLSLEDVLLDCSEYRIAYREIANTGNERSMIATVLPKGVVCHHKLHTVRPYVINPERENLRNENLHSAYERIFTDKELFVAVGLLNSLPFDFLLRSKIDNSIVMYKFRESQVPRLTDGDDWFHYISDRAARLNCYGDEFKEMRDRLGGIKPATAEKERQKLQAEIDAAAMHAYGLNQDDVEFLLNDFNRVSDPRIMTDEYFEKVQRKFEILEQKGPQS
jgi:cyanate lyase